MDTSNPTSPQTSPQSEEQAQSLGWKRNFVADEPRLSEMIENYQELGFDVITVPISPDSADCNECMTQSPEKYQVIYTRRPGI